MSQQEGVPIMSAHAMEEQLQPAATPPPARFGTFGTRKAMVLLSTAAAACAIVAVARYMGGSSSSSRTESAPAFVAEASAGQCDVTDGSGLSASYPCSCGAATCRQGQACSSSTSSCDAPQEYILSWGCPGTNFPEEDRLYLVGRNAHGSPIYSDETGKKFFFHEPMCDGTSSNPAWILSPTNTPDRCRLRDLDRDCTCNVGAAILSNDTTGPPSGTWIVMCGKNFQFQNKKVTFTMVKPALAGRGPAVKLPCHDTDAAPGTCDPDPGTATMSSTTETTTATQSPTTEEPTQSATPSPTPEPTPEPTQSATLSPTPEPTPEPTQSATPSPTPEPTQAPYYVPIKEGAYPADECASEYTEATPSAAGSADACAAAAEREGVTVFVLNSRARRPTCYLYSTLEGPCQDAQWGTSRDDTTYMWKMR